MTDSREKIEQNIRPDIGRLMDIQDLDNKILSLKRTATSLPQDLTDLDDFIATQHQKLETAKHRKEETIKHRRRMEVELKSLEEKHKRYLAAAGSQNQ